MAKYVVIFILGIGFAGISYSHDVKRDPSEVFYAHADSGYGWGIGESSHSRKDAEKNALAACKKKSPRWARCKIDNRWAVRDYNKK